MKKRKGQNTGAKTPNGAQRTTASDLRRIERLHIRGMAVPELAEAVGFSQRHVRDLLPVIRTGVPALRKAVTKSIPARVAGRIARFPARLQEWALRNARHVPLNSNLEVIRDLETNKLRRTRPGRKPSGILRRVRERFASFDRATMELLRNDPSNVRARAYADVLSFLKGELSIADLLGVARPRSTKQTK